ncbi:MAG: 1-(5-phosphoribosyl)-5-[(5-phosphoribosylamino)methylideneamino]imidazole-4-carboxamide isomerase [Deltaproteobacteria bacterium]|nr:1-(5-phosphoribosyl)-5-[(5-phosphoribosylamino)methylideneamino]imidazole-4-carboxamide isomerase [Deltaproteobacteria bacterium]
MIIIPAIDLKEGRCVRLIQGDMNQETVYSDNPPEMAKHWESLGAELLHVVDLDGAVEGRPENLPVVQQIVRELSIPVEVGGGIRTMETIGAYLDAGAARVVIGTKAAEDPAFLAEACRKYPGRIVAGIDAKKGYVAVRGWTDTTKQRAVDLARTMEGAGVTAVIFTDIQRDGMETGPNIASTKELAEAVGIPVIASGGISGIPDIENLLKIESAGVTGAITGRAIYTGALDLAEAIALTRKGRE